MAQQLRPNRLVQTSHMSLQINTPAFYSGFVAGLTNTDKRFDLFHDASEASIVEIVRNLTELARENELSEQVLLHDCGLVAGHLTRHEVRA